MIAGLVRHHPLFKTMPKLLPAMGLVATLTVNILTWKALQAKDAALTTFTLKILTFQLPETPDYSISLFWFQLVTLVVTGAGLLFRGANIRTSPWHLSLPLPAEKLWRSHFLALLIGLLSLLAFQGLVVVAMLRVLTLLTERNIIPYSQLALAFVNPALVLIFLAGLVAAFRPDLADLSQSRSWKRYRIIILLLMVVILFGLTFLPVLWGVFPAAWGLAVACRARRSLPLGLNLGNGPGQGVMSAVTGTWDKLAAAPIIFNPRSKLVDPAILNQLFKIPYIYVVLFMMMPGFFGLQMAGLSLYDSSTHGEIFRLRYYFLGIYLLFAFVGEFVLRLHKVDALPVDRRSLLRYLVLPGMAVLLLSYGGTRLWIDYQEFPQEKVSFQDRYGKFGASVAPGFNEIVRRGELFETVAPWDETHVSQARHSLPGYPSPVAAHSPFLTDGPTSREFLAWQLSRAVQEVYGIWIEPEELDERYIQIDEEGQFLVPARGFTVARDYGLKAESGGPVAPFILAPVLAGWLLVMGLYFRLLHTGRSNRWARTIFWFIMAGLFVLHFLQTINKIPFLDSFGAAVTVFATARRLGEMGLGGFVLAYGLGAAMVWVAWRYCSRMFMGVEAPPE